MKEKYSFKTTRFDYVNPKAKVVIVGITPGNSQLDGSREGMSSKEIKREYAFAGKMRPNLVNMLDYIGVNSLLDIESCKTLWDNDFDKVDMTSLLIDATYVLKKDGTKEMFRHAEKIVKSEELSKRLEDGFVENCKKYENSQLFVACGAGVYNILKKLHEEKKINGEVVCIAHPSGANMKCIQSYLGRKESTSLSLQKYIELAKEAKNCIIHLKAKK